MPPSAKILKKKTIVAKAMYVQYEYMYSTLRQIFPACNEANDKIENKRKVFLILCDNLSMSAIVLESYVQLYTFAQ